MHIALAIFFGFLYLSVAINNGLRIIAKAILDISWRLNK